MEFLPNLNTIYFGGNILGDEGFRTIIKNAKKFKNIQSIDLSYNHITSKAF